MIYFIPAWYSKNDWKENEQIWYTRRMHTEVDDTVKQLQLFDRKSSFDAQTILLQYSPNYRHFLHRQGLLHSEYWSVFDVIQGIQLKSSAVFSFHDLAWPENIEFQYTPFDIVAIKDNEKYATIEFGEDGNMIQVDLYENNELRRKNIYDDRGFLSSTMVYRNQKWSYIQYLDESGKWRICQYEDGHVEVNPLTPSYVIQYNQNEYCFSFQKQRYGDISEIIEEVFMNYVQLNEKDSIYCIAMHDLHSHLLTQVLNERKKILSFYNSRCIPSENEFSYQLVKESECVVVNSKNVFEKIGLNQIHTKAKWTDITPFDSRVDFGHSLQLKQQNILIPVDELEDEVFEKLIVIFMKYMQTNTNARINLFTRKSDWNKETLLLEKTQQILKKYKFDVNHARKQSNQRIENAFEEEVPILFSVSQCVDELSVSKCLKEQRLIVDLESNLDLFLQISAISMGVPQIVMHETDYVVDGKNGKVLKEITELDEALHYYLDTLQHWNSAMIESYEIGKKFSSDNLLNQWEGVIAYVQKC